MSSNPTENDDDGNVVSHSTGLSEDVVQSQPYNPDFQSDPELPPSYETF